MVARKFLIQHGEAAFDLEYDTDDGFEVLKFQLFSLTAIPPDQQKILGGDDDRVLLDDSDLEMIVGKLRLISIEEDEKLKEMEKSDEEFARMLQAEEEALMMQQFVTSENREQVEQRIRPYVNQVLLYEDPDRQEAARKTVPVDKLEEKAMVALAREGNFKATKDEFDHAFLLQLLFWFKHSFRWVNAPPCDNCRNDTVHHAMGVVNQSELHHGASRVEIYRCKSCSTMTRFPRYNDPMKLLETRKGRCGEWANCFTLYCRTFGYESRLILDFTDHVWTECFSPTFGRWMHLDPCEGIYDRPLLYEKGWNKSLSYVIAIGRDGVHDVTKRYTRKWHEVLSRRALVTEPTLDRIITDITRERRKYFTSELLAKLAERDRIEVEELERNLFAKDDASVSLPGRQSGDEEWRILRSEFSSDSHCSLSSSSCPVRRCVDDHVTKIYNAFSPLMRQLVETNFDKSRVIEVLKKFKNILVILKNSPFRTRRTTVNASSSCSDLHKMLPSFSQLFDALSLKTELAIDRTTDICIDSDPVKASLALPVAFHALDDLISNLIICEKLEESSLSWPLLKINRICSGSVLASGEELPFGIATSAFDGTRMSKWEEPNGATGCWIIYKVLGNEKHELVAYELMSANDAPERDPMDCFFVMEANSLAGPHSSLLHKLDVCRALTKSGRVRFVMSHESSKEEILDSNFSGKVTITFSTTFCSDSKSAVIWKQEDKQIIFALWRLVESQVSRLCIDCLHGKAIWSYQIIEVSGDGGSSWRIMDEQTSQKFDRRFQRKTFEIQSQTFLANAFRIRFLAVRDVKSTSRFQVGSIDLYARADRSAAVE